MFCVSHMKHHKVLIMTNSIFCSIICPITIKQKIIDKLDDNS